MFKINSLFQFIGEVDDQEGLILRARISRNVDGLDVSLYEQALSLRRKFEAQHFTFDK